MTNAPFFQNRTQEITYTLFNNTRTRTRVNNAT